MKTGNVCWYSCGDIVHHEGILARVVSINPLDDTIALVGKIRDTIPKKKQWSRLRHAEMGDFILENVSVHELSPLLRLVSCYHNIPEGYEIAVLGNKGPITWQKCEELDLAEPKAPNGEHWGGTTFYRKVTHRQVRVGDLVSVFSSYNWRKQLHQDFRMAKVKEVTNRGTLIVQLCDDKRDLPEKMKNLNIPTGDVVVREDSLVLTVFDDDLEDNGPKTNDGG